jgi:hypothetical protein
LSELFQRELQGELRRNAIGGGYSGCVPVFVGMNTRERGKTMFDSDSLVCTEQMPVQMLMLVAGIFSGFTSKQEHALDQAKKQAATTRQAQQVVSVERTGATTTKNEAITTTSIPSALGAPVPAHSGPTVSAVPQPLPAPADANIPAGTTLMTRVDQRISVKTSHARDTFAGELVGPLLASDSSVLVPKGAQVGSVVDVARRRGHFRGRSLLELRLTSLTMIDHACRPDKTASCPWPPAFARQ